MISQIILVLNTKNIKYNKIQFLPLRSRSFSCMVRPVFSFTPLLNHLLELSILLHCYIINKVQTNSTGKFY